MGTRIKLGIVVVVGVVVLLVGRLSPKATQTLQSSTNDTTDTASPETDSSRLRRDFAAYHSKQAMLIGPMDGVLFNATGPEDRRFVWHIPHIDSRETATMLMSGTAHDSGYVTRSQLLSLGFTEIEFESEVGSWVFNLAFPNLSDFPKPKPYKSGFSGRVYMSAVGAIQIQFLSDTRFRMMSGGGGGRAEGVYVRENNRVVLVVDAPGNPSYIFRLTRDGYLQALRADGTPSQRPQDIFRRFD
jgi:hypothetical protein